LLPSKLKQPRKFYVSGSVFARINLRAP
jgi:hypothetical protein